jgi:hypothetical protein
VAPQQWRKIPVDRDTYTTAVEGRIVGHGKTIRIRSIHLHCELAVPADALEATERQATTEALKGCRGASGPAGHAARHPPD